ncbi:MAG: SufD family Fe-S cluster assembly protein [Candidatus Moranbacteria bacterium]|nr:SufD family Fe-S cluster assembly protein [Candidatus Moranbacteria bacterium]
MLYQKDISKDPQTLFQINKPGNFFYFFRNRTEKIIFEITAPNSHILLYGIFENNNNENISFITKQHHIAPNTSSQVIIKSALRENTSLEHHGIIRLEKSSKKSKASFESRHLLLEESSQASVKPYLEILTEDISCSHAVTISPPNPELIFYLTTRGISQEQAKKILAKAFVNFSSQSLALSHPSFFEKNISEIKTFSGK